MTLYKSRWFVTAFLTITLCLSHVWGAELPKAFPEDYKGFYVIDTKIYDGNGTAFVNGADYFLTNDKGIAKIGLP